jgi:hypothetical protein
MKSFCAPLLAALLLPFGMGGCEKAAPPPTEAVLFQTIEDSARAVEKKDLDGLMATVHPKSAAAQTTRATMSELFQAVTLKCTLSDLHIVTASPKEARVSFTQKTEKVSGDIDFPNNIIQGVHVLKPDDGRWKIFTTIRTNLTDTNGRPLGTEELVTQEHTPAIPATPPTEAAPAPATPAPSAEKSAQ